MRPIARREITALKSESHQLSQMITPELLAKQQDVSFQRATSAKINAANVFSEGNTVLGRRKAMAYNQRNCIAVSRRTPLSWRRQGIELGFPRNITCSAKAVARQVQPEVACARSLADRLVLDGVSEDSAFEVGRAFVQPFRLLINTGWLERQISI